MNDKRTAGGVSRPSARSDVRPFVAMDMLRLANAEEAAGRRIIHMEVGQPSAPIPKAVRLAAERGLADGNLRYTEALGTTPLRRAIAEQYQSSYSADVDPERVAVTVGSSGAFTLAFLAAFNPGDRVAISSPGYPAYRNILQALGLEAVEIELTALTGPNITPEQLAAAHEAAPLAGVVVASPANPTGSMLTPDELSRLIATAERLGIRFVSDEIYHGLVYDGVAATALGFSDRAIVINSFSKYYCMAGWRVGWAVLPDELLRPVERLAQNLYLSPPDLSQRAAIGALEATDELEEIKAGYAGSRALLLQKMGALGFEDSYPVDGAFYYYASIGRHSNDSTEFARRMLLEAGVAATPGVDFDLRHGSRMIRFSFAGRTDDVAEAVARLEDWLK